MQTDEVVYLHPARAKLPRPVQIIGEHDFPDMVLEVDPTTCSARYGSATGWPSARY